MKAPWEMSPEELAVWAEELAVWAEESGERAKLREIVDTMRSRDMLTEQTHARALALIAGEPDPFPDPDPKPIEPSPGCGLSNEQALRIAASVMETIGTLGAPRGTPIDAARIMGITLGIGRALAPWDAAGNFQAAFDQGLAIAAAWAAQKRAGGS